jgi:flagellar FliL protein
MADEDDEADDEEDEGEDSTSNDLGGKKKLILILVATLLLALIVAGGLYFFGFFDTNTVNEESSVIEENLDEENTEEANDEEQSLKETSVEKTSKASGEKTQNSVIVKGQFYHQFEDLNVNLVSKNKKPRFLRMSLTVAVTQEEDILVVENLAPRVVDNVIQYLSGLRPNEIAGTANFIIVQDNILLRVRAAVAPVVVTDALITLALVK